MTGRRAFVAALALSSVGVRAQQPRPARIAMLVTGTPESHGYLVDAFLDAMRKLGYVEGRDVVYAYRWAQGQPDRFPALVAELAREDPDIIVTATAASTRAAMKEAPRAAVLMAYGSDPVGNGLVASLARPGGRVTGLSNLGEGVVPKMMELLQAMVPRMQRIGMLVNPTNLTAKTFGIEAKAAASKLKVTIALQEASNPEAIPPAFDRMMRERPDGIVVTPDPVFLAMRARLVELAARNRVATIYFQREFVAEGGLVSYGSSIRDAFVRAASYADRILKGADPGSLPVEQPTKFELVVNMKTAKALGLTIPQSLLLRADEVIQ